ncbi:MAG: homoserine kinase [Salinisphaeraceae bacterium]|nr:homoserine kinase [Salinisphaeraceae bacterium]
MSVYTRVQAADLEDFLAGYSVGELEGFEGISAGITNTNYFVDTGSGRWVLTLFEKLSDAELPFYLDLMDHLAGQGVPSAHPVARRDGRFHARLNGKPAALVHRLRGASVDAPDARQCAAMGAVVAEMHKAADSFGGQNANVRGLDWMQRTRRELAERLDTEDLALLDDELAFQQAAARQSLPRGVIHADLFRDNVLFEGHHVSGLIDFYYACQDILLFDLAVICNDWCIDDQGRFDPAAWQALSAAYARRRPYSADEHDAWPGVLRLAALRFWLSRLQDWLFPRDGDDTHQKDPAPLKEILLAHRERTPALLPTGPA